MRSDHQDIVYVLVRYATGIDTRDWALFRTCFSDDAHFDYGCFAWWWTKSRHVANFLRATAFWASGQ